MDSEIMSGIIKTHISDHSAIFCTIKAYEKYHSNKFRTFKSDTNKDTKGIFKYFLKNIAWRDVLSNESTSEAYNSFLSKYTDLYKNFFQKNEVKTKVIRI